MVEKKKRKKKKKLFLQAVELAEARKYVFLNGGRSRL